MTRQPQRLTPDIPVVDPRTARKGRFLVSRRRWDDIGRYAQELEDTMRARHVTLASVTLVACYHTALHSWALYAMEAGK